LGSRVAYWSHGKTLACNTFEIPRVANPSFCRLVAIETAIAVDQLTTSTKQSHTSHAQIKSHCHIFGGHEDFALFIILFIHPPFQADYVELSSMGKDASKMLFSLLSCVYT
jgi:hypothetical protein